VPASRQAGDSVRGGSYILITSPICEETTELSICCLIFLIFWKGKSWFVQSHVCQE
jgi:hypothetical protein